MIGIVSCGAYIPRYRMNRKVIFEQMGWFNPATAAVARGEKAVANYDEDTVTMAVAAAMDCLDGLSRDGAGGLYLASTSLPFAQRQNAVIVSEALDFPAGVRTADFTGTLKGGTTALLAALDAAGAEGSGPFLVAASESRVGKPGSSQEHTFGDGAAALLVGRENVIAEFKGSFSVSHDFVDYRRLNEERFEHGWEERWIREEGYGKIIPEAALGLAKKYRLKPGDFARIVIGCPVAALVAGLGKGMGARPEQIQDNLAASAGDTGTALPLMMLVAAIEQSKPGDKILVLSYGNGSDALYFEVTPEIEKRRDRKGISGHLPLRADFTSYGKYLVFRDLIPLEVGIRGEEIAPMAMSVLYREGKSISALVGSRCRTCGTPQYPPQKVCVNPACGAVDDMEPYRFSDKIGKLASYTGDNLAFSLDPPAVYGLVDFKEGGRLFLDITDCQLEKLKVGMPVRMTFRRKYADVRRAIFGYYWKATPA
ncbi:MAG: OB-fold domain-containing protein [Syntrophales bacterium]|nr:OB-fold domain-containing protein [Syntrophales bacterium]MDD5533226.1 OB-fold domain-containing protein [Syntrophales bacterium]